MYKILPQIIHYETAGSATFLLIEEFPAVETDRNIRESVQNGVAYTLSVNITGISISPFDHHHSSHPCSTLVRQEFQARDSF